MDVGAWLRGLGLGRYEAAFRENDVAADVLPRLTAGDLKEIGVASVGDRRRLLDAIAALNAAAPAPASSAAPAPGAPPTPAPAPAADAVAPASAERRQVTVLFCDLAGSTALSARLDPEDLREVMAAYHRAVTEVVRAQGGYVAKLPGDGVLAYFGWPQAREDDAERAVRAGLAAAEAVAGLEAPGAGAPLAARVGLATGPVVVGEVLGKGEARERGVVGGDAQPRRPPAGRGRAGRGGGRRRHAPAHGRAVRVGRPRRDGAEGPAAPGACLAGAG